jgi:peptidoglycan-N-acetylglucosamine deacetylase
MTAFSPRLLSLLTVVLAAVCTSPAGWTAEPPRPRKIAITIDDGPATGPTELEAYVKISDALRETFVAEKVPAIMFVNERQLNLSGQRDSRAALLERWLEAGLELGNHTYSHPRIAAIGLPGFLDDIVKGEVITRPLLEARGRKLVWFRYPFLDTGRGDQAKAIEDFLAQRVYRIAPVTVDYADYNHSGIYVRHLRAGDQAKADEQYATMLQALDAAFDRAEARSKELLGYELPLVLLIHCNELNALTLRRTLQRMRERGYAFVSLDEAMADPAYQVPLRPGAMGGGGWFNALAAARAASPGN